MQNPIPISEVANELKKISRYIQYMDKNVCAEILTTVINITDPDEFQYLKQYRLKLEKYINNPDDKIYFPHINE